MHKTPRIPGAFCYTYRMEDGGIYRDEHKNIDLWIGERVNFEDASDEAFADKLASFERRLTTAEPAQLRAIHQALETKKDTGSLVAQARIEIALDWIEEQIQLKES